jgi:hypothetical protein
MSAPPALTIEVLAGSRAGERLTVALPCTIGRAPDTGVVLNDAHLSSVHGRIELTEGAVLFSDRGSTNGSVHVRSGMVTPLNSECPVVEVWTGDELHLGDPAQPVVLRVTLAEANPGEILAVRPIAEVEAFQQRVTADAERLQVLYRHTAELSRQTDVDGVLTLAARLIFDLLPRATHVAVALRERGGHFPVALARSRNGDPVALPVSRTLIRKVVEERAGLLLSDAGAEVSARSVAQAGLLSTLCVPLWTGSDVRGAIQVDNRDAPGLFGGADLEVLTVAAAQISFAAENARLVARLRLAEQKLEGENRFLKKREEDATFGGIVGRSAGINNVLRALEKVRDTRVPVLINGETGTGKELVARALHYTSARREKLFVAQNCSALPENLLESELFGHVGAPSRAPIATRRASSSCPTAARCSSTRSGRCRSPCRRSCCGCCRRARSGPSAPAGLGKWTSGSSARPIATWRRWFAPAASVRTSSTVCTCSRSTCPRCASGGTTCRSSPATSWSATRGSWAAR